MLLKRDLRKNLAKSTGKEKTGEAIHRTPYGQSCADEEQTRSESDFPHTHSNHFPAQESHNHSAHTAKNKEKLYAEFLRLS